MKFRVLALAAALVAGACGGNDNASKTPPGSKTPDYSSLAITLDPSHVALRPGEARTVTVNILRIGSFKGQTTTLAVSGAPTDVTATFDNVSTLATSVVLTLTAKADAATSTDTITVSATAEGTAATTPLTLAVGPSAMTVNGRILATTMRPFGPAKVEIWSAGATTPVTVDTGEDGRFSASGIIPPYDLHASALVAVGGPTIHLVYPGLTTDAPLIATLAVADGPFTVTQIVATDGTPPANTASLGALECAASTGATVSTDTTVTVQAFGFFGNAETCALYGLQGHIDTDGYLTSFTEGQSSIDIALGGNDVALPLTSAITKHNITATVSTADGNGISTVSQYWAPSPNVWIAVNDVSPAPGTYAHVLAAPDDAAANIFLWAEEDGLQSTSIITKPLSGAAIATFSVSIPAPPAVTAPADASTIALPVTFTATTVENAAYIFAVFDGDNQQETLIASATSTLSSAVLDKLGLALMAGHDYQAAVATYGGCATVDDLASSKATQSAFFTGGGAWQATSEIVGFSTSP